MTGAASSTQKIRVGSFIVDPASNVIRLDDKRFKLEPRVMDVLVTLATAAGEVVTRDTLLEAHWSVEHGADESLTRAIYALRKALKVDTRIQRYIETVPKRGYRLICPVSPYEDAKTETSQQSQVSSETRPSVSSYSSPSLTPYRESELAREPDNNNSGQKSIVQRLSALHPAFWIAGVFTIFAGLYFTTSSNQPGKEYSEENTTLTTQSSEASVSRDLFQRILAVTTNSTDTVEFDAEIRLHKAVQNLIASAPEAAESLARGNFVGAYELLESKSADSQFSPQAFVALGTILFSPDPKTAHRALTKATEYVALSSDAHLDISRLNYDLQKDDLGPAYSAALAAERAARNVEQRLNALDQVAFIELEMGNLKKAEERYENIVSLTNTQVELAPGNSEWLTNMVWATFGLCETRQEFMLLEKALEPCLASVDWSRKRLDTVPDDLSAKNDLAMVLTSVGNLQLRRDKPAEAKTVADEAYTIVKALKDANPLEDQVLQQYTRTAILAGSAYQDAGMPAQSIEYFRQALDAARLRRASDPESSDVTNLIYNTLNLAGKIEEMGRRDAAISLYEEALELAEGVVGSQSEDTRNLLAAAYAYHQNFLFLKDDEHYQAGLTILKMLDKREQLPAFELEYMERYKQHFPHLTPTSGE